jgi:serine/threonine-protein kinase
MTLLIGIVAAAAWLAHRNLARGRGDRSGAWRLAVYAFAVGLVGWALWAHHVADLAGEITMMVRADGVILLAASCIWVLYLALEPYVRRRSPHLLISWTRLLAGRWRDAAVGRDVLVGAAAGAVMAVVVVLTWRLPGWIGRPEPWPRDHDLDAFLGVRERLMNAVLAQLDSAAAGLGILVLLVLLRMVVRSELVAGAAILVILGIPDAIASDLPWYAALALAMAIMSFGVFVLMRFGLLALIVTLYTCSRALMAPFSLRFGHWTGAPTAFSLLLIAALVVWGLWASASRRRLAVVHDLAA